MKQLFIFLVVNICLLKIASAQKEFNNWFFGSNSGLNFGSGTPVFRAGNLVSLEGCSSISDKQGNLLFYTNGVTVWDRNGQVMPNGSGLNGDVESTQSALITNHPGNDSIYYIFTVAKEGSPIGLQYSIVNMKRNGGLGDVDLSRGKNVSFNLPVCEKVLAVKHRNRNDIWIIARRYGSDEFVEYLIDCSGLVAFPRFIKVGPMINTPNNTQGYLKASPDGKKLAMANFQGNFELFDFDDATGLISNPQTVASSPIFLCGPYGVEFSPDSKLLYVTEVYSCNTPVTYDVCQYKLDTTDIAASKVILDNGVGNVAGALQLGPDNKIYIAYNQVGSLGAITTPNGYGPAAGFVKQYLNLTAPALSGAGLPNIAAAYNETLLGEDTVICDGTSLTIKLNLPNTTYEWNNGSTADSLVISANGQYSVKITHGSCVYRDTINVTMQPSPVFNLDKDTAICQNKFPYLLKKSVPGATYLWQDGSTDSSYTARSAGTYWLKATINGCARTDSITISSSPLTQFNLGADTTICANTALTLTVSAPSSGYLWNTGSTSQSIVTGSSGIYWSEATNANGCVYRDSIKITFNPAPVVNIGKDTSLCQNKFPLRLAQSLTGATYLWQDGSVDSSILVSSAGLYWMRASVNGCSTSDSILISAKVVDTFNLGNDSVICGSQPLTLTVTPAFTKYLWSTGSTSKSINVSNTGVYWSEATNNSGCTFRDSITLAFNPSSVVNLGNDTSLCQDKLPLSIGKNINNATYLWQDGSTNALFSVNTPGVYWVQATINGCSARDSIVISVGTVTPFNLGADTVSCANQAITLGVNQPFTKYLWNTGVTTRSIRVSNSGQYWLEATNNSGCSYRDTINVSFSPAPVVNLGKDTAVCPEKLPLVIGQTIGGAAYLWQDGSTNAFYSVVQPGVYWMQAIVNGCSARDTITVSTGTPTGFSLGADTVLCTTQPLVLGVNGSFSRYLWSTGSTTKNITVTSSGDYWLEATANSGCSYRDSIHLDFKSPPLFSLGGDTIICNDASYLLDISNTGDSYLWQDNSSRSQYLVSKSGSYRVLVTRNGCTKADTVAITFKSKPVPDLGVDRIICTGQELILSPSIPGTFTWQDGTRDATYKVTAPGSYRVDVENECGTGTDEVFITKGSCNLMVPNAFTPDKGLNNTFRLLNGYGLKDFRLQVFNRWGQLVYQTSNSTEGWNGKYKGVDQPSGTYIYIISYTDDATGKTTQKGAITLIR